MNKTKELEILKHLSVKYAVQQIEEYVVRFGQYDSKNSPALTVLNQLISISEEYYEEFIKELFDINVYRDVPSSKLLEYLIDAGYNLVPFKDLLFKILSDMGNADVYDHNNFFRRVYEYFDRYETIHERDVLEKTQTLFLKMATREFFELCEYYEMGKSLPFNLQTLDELLKIDNSYYLNKFIENIFFTDIGQDYSIDKFDSMGYLISSTYDLSSAKDLLYQIANSSRFIESDTTKLCEMLDKYFNFDKNITKEDI